MLKFVLFVVCSLITVKSSIAQHSGGSMSYPYTPPSDTAKVKARLQEIFEYARTQQYEKAAKYLVYRGQDSARAWIDHFHYSDPKERKEVEKICNWFVAFLKKKDHEYQLFQIVPDRNVTWYVWNLTYDDNGNRPSVAFAFKKVKGEFCLGDIDEF